MVDQEIIGSQLKSDRFPFQSEGDITLAVRNADYSLGPVMLHIVMKPKAVIPAHVHKGMAEALYVVEGDFINEGKQHQAGTRYISRSARNTVRTLPKMAANYSSSGRMERRNRLPISATLSSPKRQLASLRTDCSISPATREATVDQHVRGFRRRDFSRQDLARCCISCAADVRRYRTHYSGLIDRGPKRCRGKPRDIVAGASGY